MPRSWLLRAFRNLLRRDRIDEDLDEEVRSYVNLLPMKIPRRDSLSRRLVVLVLMGAFGAVGLFLAALGLFGLVNHLVVLRRQEIVQRIALGATPYGVVQTLVGEGIRLAGIGVALGLVGAVGMTRLLSGMLFGVQPS